MTIRATFCACLALGAFGTHAEPINLPGIVYTLDPTATHSRFEAKFLGLITVRGKFNRTTGKLLHHPAWRDAAGRATDSIDAEIDATSLDAHVANSETTNQILRGPEFFNVEKFPVIAFRSSRFNWEGDKLKSIEGGLTLLGVTRAATFTVEKSGCTPATTAGARARCTADAFVEVMRSDFGMRGWSASVSNEVKIIIALVAVAEPLPAAESKEQALPKTEGPILLPTASLRNP